SIEDITEHNLPRPSLFAYPFSDSLGGAPHTASGYANALIHKLFATTMTNYIVPAVPLSRREAAQGIVSRIEVTSSETATTLFSRLREIASLPVTNARPFSNRARWEAPNGRTANIAIAGRDIILKGGHAKWVYAAYAPGETADWDGYRIS